MSNKLWRKKYEFVVDRNGEVFVKLDDGTYDIIWVRKDKPLQDVIVFSENGIKFIEEYCYLDDLIAQVDKAERLQAKLRTIAYMEQRRCIDDPVDILDDVLKIAKDEIKQLIKEN